MVYLVVTVEVVRYVEVVVVGDTVTDIETEVSVA